MILQAVFCGLISLRLGDSQLDVKTRVGTLTFIVAIGVYDSVFATVQFLPEKREILERDRHAKTYGTVSFYVSSVLTGARKLFFLRP